MRELRGDGHRQFIIDDDKLQVISVFATNVDQEPVHVVYAFPIEPFMPSIC